MQEVSKGSTVYWVTGKGKRVAKVLDIVENSEGRWLVLQLIFGINSKQTFETRILFDPEKVKPYFEEADNVVEFPLRNRDMSGNAG